jgi:hypothetical protein
MEPLAHGIATHQPGIVGLQQFSDATAPSLMLGVEPRVVAIWIKNHWHPVVDGRGLPLVSWVGPAHATVSNSTPTAAVSAMASAPRT